MSFTSPPIQQGKSRPEIYENKKVAISECLKQLNALTISLNEVCNQANLLGRSMQSLEELTLPEIIGDDQSNKAHTRKFKFSALSDALDTFSKIFITYSERIKNEAIDNFDNFIMQAILPNADEVKGSQEHNEKIVIEFRESFFSLYNHFFILGAELMEKFLICNNCSTPIGFPHQPLCLTKSLSKPNVWKKAMFDDKFITFAMNLSFNDLIDPESRKNILTQVADTCMKQLQTSVQGKPSIQLLTRSWPDRWLRGEKNKGRKFDKTRYAKARNVHTPIHHRLFKPSIWTPQPEDFPSSSCRVPPGFNCKINEGDEI